MRLSCAPFASFLCQAFFAAFASLAFPVNLFAQSPDAVGVRAQGMGGAFTAIADDASATWWNPAGLASGAYLNLLLEYGEATDSPLPDNGPHRGVALAFPALGLSYYRMAVSQMRASSSTAASTAVRQDPGTFGFRTLEVSQFGATVGQSLSNHLVIASTLKLLRGGGESEGDLDVGAMVAYRTWRVGLMARNVREAELGEGDEAVSLQRQFRAGLAWSSAANTAYGGAALAFDADLRAVPTAFGDERRLAAGGEVWTRARWLGVRAGISGSTLGERREAYSAGVSLAVRRGIFGEGQLTGGSDPLRSGWSLGLRVTF